MCGSLSCQLVSKFLFKEYILVGKLKINFSQINVMWKQECLPAMHRVTSHSVIIFLVCVAHRWGICYDRVVTFESVQNSLTYH